MVLKDQYSIIMSVTDLCYTTRLIGFNNIRSNETGQLFFRVTAMISQFHNYGCY